MCNAIPILSPFFLYHPYIPHSLIRRIFNFLVHYADLPHTNFHTYTGKNALLAKISPSPRKTPGIRQYLDLGKIFCDHLNVLSLASDDEAMKPARCVHLLGNHAVCLLVHLVRECVRV